MSILKKAGNWLAQKAFSLTDVVTYRKLMGGESYSGKTVNERTAMQLSTVWSCVRLIAETIATLPIIVYQRNVGDDGRVVARDYPLYSILHDSPNADMTAVEFWEAIVAQLCLRGNAYCLKTLALGKLISLDPLRADWMEPKRQKNGSILFCYSDPAGYVEYSEDEIWHVKGFGVDGLVGLSPVTHARNCFGAAQAADEASGKVFTNGLRAGGALTMPNVLTPAQRDQVRDSLAAQLASTANSGRLMVLEGGSTYAPLSINPDDAQMLQTRAFNIEEMCRWFQVAPSMIGHGTAVSNWGTGREQIMLGFLTFTLRPYLTRLEQGIKKSLIPAADRGRYFAEFSLEGLLRADSAARSAFYASAVQNGWMTRNEVRGLENLAAVDGGNELTVQSNLIPLSMLGKITSTAGAAKAAMLNWLGFKPDGDTDETQT